MVQRHHLIDERGPVESGSETRELKASHRDEDRVRATSGYIGSGGGKLK
jgi:hypothetical protein